MILVIAEGTSQHFRRELFQGEGKHESPLVDLPLGSLAPCPSQEAFVTIRPEFGAHPSDLPHKKTSNQ